MLELNEKDKNSHKLNELKSTVKSLQTESNSVYAEHQTLCRQRNELRKEITQLISETKELRKERDALTTEVKTEKNKRSELSTQIKEKIGEAKEVNKETKGAANIGWLKHQINAINTKIETSTTSTMNK